MLYELWLYMTMRTPAWVGEMGYLTESISIQSRHGRCREAWEPHLEKTKQFIENQASQATSKKTCAVIGSGWLLDIPLETLSKQFAEVLLLDIIHPNGVKTRAKKLGNVQCIGGDITGVCKRLHQLGKQLEFPGPSSDPPPLPSLEKVSVTELGAVDFAISSNILSQIPYVPLLWLEAFRNRQGYPLYGKSTLQEYARKMIEHHINMLGQIAPNSCLISDHTSNVYDKQGDKIDTIDLIYGAKLPEALETWEWELAPSGEIHPEKRYLNEVAAIRLSH